MGNTPTTTNGTAQTVDQIISDSIYNAALPIVEAAVIAEVPFFGLPGVKQAFEFLLNYFAQKFYAVLADFTTIQIINIQTGSELSATTKAEGALRLAHLTGDPNAIAKATLDYEKAVDALIHWDGSTTP